MFGRRKKKGAAEDAAGEAEQVVDSVDAEADEVEGEREHPDAVDPHPYLSAGREAMARTVERILAGRAA
ncbi:hypothetical protein ABZT00_19845, partial [Streptomyces sp. NPDC005486]